MVAFLSLLLLAFAVSLDSLGVGFTYGLRKIRFPWWSLAVVTMLSASTILLAMGLGHLLIQLFSPEAAKRVGAVILILVGIWAVYQMFSRKSDNTDEPKNVSPLEPPAGTETEWSANPSPGSGATVSYVFQLELKKVGLVIQILKTPSIADMDRSGSISSSEAIVLGIALSMDGFGAGIGASLVGYPPVLTATTISLMSLLFIGLGLKIGHIYAETPFVRKLAILPGILLIMIGISKLFS
ncbi:MntP/YtaF family protein [Effusibacillus dendaii]|uniref:Sporulation membrane protein YtaF n=1 Tax=Effusibacillus dendaii TaxID=2743772 RepID=A0A7I8DD48_9BACL|nr:MntP/YtaF family protein [Effusibacillus dendaii]BCJ88034.1 sporulation membrane protein YtaF [Effusibacillus dendaii]